MKNFQKFLEEADVKGNPGIPGEGGRKQGETSYLSDVERRAKTRMGITDRDMPRMTPMGMMPSEKLDRLGRRIMELLPQSIQLSRGNEEALAKLATDTIYNLYKDIIDRYQIELDIKFSRNIKQDMEESEDEQRKPEYREITDKNVIKEIHKRKLANLVIQGEAKNTKHLLHMEEVKDGLNEILGEADGKRLFDILDEIAKTADQLDWIIPEQVKAEMMEEMPEGLAGASSVGWKPKEKKEEDQEEGEEEYQEFTGEEEYNEEEYQEEDSTSHEGETPVLKARGIDFSMLLHEAVKGLFEILSLMGLPVIKNDDNETDEEATKKLLNMIYSNTGLSDEPQDFKYGPEIAADLRDFVNQNDKIDLYPNVREELWKTMIDRDTMSTDEFISLMRGILSKTPEARNKVDRLINKVIEMIKNEKEGLDQYNREMDEYERKMKEYNQEKEHPEFAEGEDEPESDIDKLVKQSLAKKDEPKEKNNKEVDYSTWSQKELQDEIDDALDSGNYDKVKLLSKYLKEGRIYLRELEIINEKLNPHTK